MKKIVTLVAASAVAIALAACGSDDSATSGTGSGAGNPTDRAFAQDMIPHHEAAVAMAEIAQDRGQSRFVKQLADNIVGAQNRELETLRARDRALADAGVSVGDLGMDHDMMGMDDDPSMLEDASPFDSTFIEMMIPHHEGAIVMARVELEKGSDPKLRQLAQDIVDAQEREITEMKDHASGSSGMHDTEHAS
jgi:uncharacterized protein (DUF305 family)